MAELPGDGVKTIARAFRLLELMADADRALALSELASEQLKDLVALLGETANLATLDGDQALYVSQAPSPHAMRTPLPVKPAA